MNAATRRGTVIAMADHPAARRRAEQAATAVEWIGLAELPVDPRVAARIARRERRDGIDPPQVRLTLFRPLFSLRWLWRHWRLGLSLSRLWWIPAKPATSCVSLPDEAGLPKRSPGPVGVHRSRDFRSACRRHTPHGGSTR
jgi:hypothetical protein